MNKISNCWNSSNWRSWFPILALFTLLWLVTCSRGISQGGGGPEVTDEVGETPTATPALTKVAASEPAPTATALVISEATSSLSPTEEPTNVPATPKICSPLAIHPIVELPEIVSAEDVVGELPGVDEAMRAIEDRA